MYDYDKLDEIATDGRLTEPYSYEFDMGAIKDFVKRNNRTYESLTEEELEGFRLKEQKTMVR